MKQFGGFPARMQFTPVPNLFLTLLPDIDDINELKVTLYIMKMAYGRKGSPRFVTRGELMGDPALVESLACADKAASEGLRDAIEKAVERGTILRLTLVAGEKPEEVYFLNGESERRDVEKVKNGELVLSGFKAGVPGVERGPAPPDIFAVYEQNVGMLTPMIAEELRQAEAVYPQEWIRDAIKEAVSLNKRNWRYIERILENWSNEGKGNGADRGDSKANPDKFSRQRYGHIVKR